MATTAKKILAKGRSITDFPNLTVAEVELLRACREGEVANFGGVRPENGTPENTIRPSLIRFLLLGGDDQNPVHEKGIQIEGAWISDELDPGLDLRSVQSNDSLLLYKCNIHGVVNLRDANLPQLGFAGCSFNGLWGDRFKCAGGLFLNKVVCRGQARLSGAEVGGNLECNGGQFDGVEIEDIRSDALNCGGAKVKGSVFLGEGFAARGKVSFLEADAGGSLECGGGSFKNSKGDALVFDRAKISGSVFLNKGFKSEGKLRFLSAQVGINLECDGHYDDTGVDSGKEVMALSGDGAMIAGSVLFNAGFIAKGAVRLIASEIGKDLDCSGCQFGNESGNALCLSGAVVKGAFSLRGNTEVSGLLDLSGMQCGRLNDSPMQHTGIVSINGLTYERFAGYDSPKAASRIAWLMKQSIGDLHTNFRSQPWEQVIKVFREMGLEADARKVAIAKQKQMRIADKVGSFPLRQFHWLYGVLAGYGYIPLRTIYAMLVVWFCCGIFYWVADYRGLFGPTSPIVTADQRIANICGFAQGRRETSWTRCPEVPQEYTTFSPIFYSLDLILPLVDLQQEKDWSPIVMLDSGVETIALGYFTRLLMWFEILFGWAMSLLLVAVLGNLVKKD